MEFDEYQARAMRNKVYGYGDKIIYPALGLGNEAGEVQGKIKKVLRDGIGDFDVTTFLGKDKDGNEIRVPAKQAIADELGDVLWYLAALADDIGWGLDAIAQLNIEKLDSRRERGVIQGSGDNR